MKAGRTLNSGVRFAKRRNVGAAQRISRPLGKYDHMGRRIHPCRQHGVVELAHHLVRSRCWPKLESVINATPPATSSRSFVYARQIVITGCCVVSAEALAQLDFAELPADVGI